MQLVRRMEDGKQVEEKKVSRRDVLPENHLATVCSQIDASLTADLLALGSFARNLCSLPVM